MFNFTWLFYFNGRAQRPLPYDLDAKREMIEETEGFLFYYHKKLVSLLVGIGVPYKKNNRFSQKKQGHGIIRALFKLLKF